MPSFLAALPTWAWVLIVIVAMYLVYRWWKYKKSIAYAPHIVRGEDTIITPRDNPPNA